MKVIVAFLILVTCAAYDLSFGLPPYLSFMAGTVSGFLLGDLINGQ